MKMSIFPIVEQKTGQAQPADRAASKILVTAYLSTSYLSECQFHRTEICDHLVRKPTIGLKWRTIHAMVKPRPHRG
jgi:hypothetical protein